MKTEFTIRETITILQTCGVATTAGALRANINRKNLKKNTNSKTVLIKKESLEEYFCIKIPNEVEGKKSEPVVTNEEASIFTDAKKVIRLLFNVAESSVTPSKSRIDALQLIGKELGMWEGKNIGREEELEEQKKEKLKMLAKKIMGVTETSEDIDGWLSSEIEAIEAQKRTKGHFNDDFNSFLNDVRDDEIKKRNE